MVQMLFKELPMNIWILFRQTMVYFIFYIVSKFFLASDCNPEAHNQWFVLIAAGLIKIFDLTISKFNFYAILELSK